MRPRVGAAMLAWAGLLAVGAAGHTAAASDGQATRRLRLRDALEIARQRHVQVIVGSERVQQAIARLHQAQSVLWPHVSTSASESRQTKNLEAMGISLPGRNPFVGPFNSFDARLALTQTLFDVAAIQRLRSAKSGAARSLAESRKAKQDALALVASLYLEAVRAMDAIELADALRQRGEARLRLARTRLNLGLASPLEVAQAQAQWAESRRQWSTAFSQAEQRRLDLAAALGLRPAEALVLELDETVVAWPLPGDQAILAAMPAHPDVAVAQELVRERAAERAAEMADVLPRVAASGDYGASGKDPSEFEQTYTFGVKVSMPVFEGGLRAAKMHEASSRLRESEARLDEARSQVEVEALGARQAIVQAWAAVEAVEAEVAASSRRLTLARQRLQAGIGSELDVIEARAQAALARDHHQDALATYRLAEVNVMHALGRVDALLEQDGGG